jgi:hypothetical protein
MAGHGLQVDALVSSLKKFKCFNKIRPIGPILCLVSSFHFLYPKKWKRAGRGECSLVSTVLQSIVAPLVIVSPEPVPTFGFQLCGPGEPVDVIWIQNFDRGIRVQFQKKAFPLNASKGAGDRGFLSAAASSYLREDESPPQIEIPVHKDSSGNPGTACLKANQLWSRAVACSCLILFA